jgi:hypothetical protein
MAKERDRTPLEVKLGEVQPARIVARLSDDSTRTLRPSPQTRKKWIGVVASLAQLDWTQLELCDAQGQILEIFPNPDGAGAKAERIDVGQFGKSEIREMILAQREALTWQDRGQKAALDACVSMMREMSIATQSVIELYKSAEREHKALIRELERAVGRQAGGDELPSDGIVAALAPALLGRLLEGAAPPMKAPNGKGS